MTTTMGPKEMYQNDFYTINTHGWYKLLDRLLGHDAYLKVMDKIHFILLSFWYDNLGHLFFLNVTLVDISDEAKHQ